MKKKAEKKILSFSTTMRNQYRIGSFLAIISKYENQILTHEVIMNIIKEILTHKLFVPNIVKNTAKLKACLDDDNCTFSEENLNYIIKHCSQKHKERGFNKGWESRFDTFYKLMSEFGFCYYAKNQKILISDSAKLLINAFYDTETNTFRQDVDEERVGNIFLNVLSKYEVGNPYKKNKNHNIPFRLLIQLLQKLKQEQQRPICIKEIPILLCWQNNNLNELYDYIICLREESYKKTSINFGYSDEFIYEKCLLLLESNNRKRFKISQVTKEAVDEYIRKMRITGLISLRGNGKFLDINSNEHIRAEYIASLNSSFAGNYMDDIDDSRLKFYEYMSTIDMQLLEEPIVATNDDIKIIKLKEISQSYDIKSIENELIITCDKNKASRDNLLKLIDKPLRLEFLTAMYLVKKFSNIDVIPNYKCDDEGYPIFTASGGKADIIAYDHKVESYIEVSLLRDRTQTVNEMIPIVRHLQDYINKSNNSKDKFSVFIAPNIHQDAIEYAKYVKFKKKISVPYYGISDFISKVKSITQLSEINDESLLVS